MIEGIAGSTTEGIIERQRCRKAEVEGTVEGTLLRVVEGLEERIVDGNSGSIVEGFVKKINLEGIK